MSTRKRRRRPAGALLLTNIGQLLTLRSSSPNSGPRRGVELKELGIIRDGAVLCIGGKIVSVGPTKDALRDPWIRKSRKQLTEIDCACKVVIPGFVDSHTHPVFVSPRLVDFEKRIEGASYDEIAAAGGGIRSSLEGVRKATKSVLKTKVLAVLQDMAAHGTKAARTPRNDPRRCVSNVRVDGMVDTNGASNGVVTSAFAPALY